MNHQKHYNKLMERAPKVKPKEGYFERHRIVPGCMGGKYVTGNIVWLIPEEHYVAHQLLVKMHPGNRDLIYAAHMMGQTRKGNKTYGWLRRLFSENNPMQPGMTNSGSFKPGKDHPHKSNYKSFKPGEQSGEKNYMFGKKNLAISERNQSKVDCPYCEKSGGSTIMNRWHFENCKERGI